jgi:hypothetical protein
MPTFAPGSLGGPAWREEVTQLDVERQVAKLKREKSTLGKAISRADAAVKSMARKHQAVHSANALRLLTKRTKGEELLFRERIYLTVNEPSSGLIAYAFANTVKYHVILCCFAFMVESVEYVTTRTGAAMWMVLRIYFNVFFTVEATLRVAGHIPIRRSLTDPVLFLDIWSVLPFWVRLLAFPKSITPGQYLVRHSRPLTVRTFESIGMIRLLKLSSHYYGAEARGTAHPTDTQRRAAARKRGAWLPLHAPHPFARGRPSAPDAPYAPALGSCSPKPSVAPRASCSCRPSSSRSWSWRARRSSTTSSGTSTRTSAASIGWSTASTASSSSSTPTAPPGGVTSVPPPPPPAPHRCSLTSAERATATRPATPIARACPSRKPSRTSRAPCGLCSSPSPPSVTVTSRRARGKARSSLRS